MGYSSKDSKPFEELVLIPDAEAEVDNFLAKPENETYKSTVEKTKLFLTGFYSPFSLELLSTIDFIISEKKADTEETIAKELENWNSRKKALYANPKFIQIALANLRLHLN